MSQIAGLQDFRQEGPPADIGVYALPSTALVFRHVFEGVVYYVAVRSGDQGWVLLSHGQIPETVVNTAFTTLGAGAKMILLNDTYQLVTVGFSFSANSQVLEGMGRGTFVDGDALATGVHAINLNGYNDCEICNFSVQTEDGGGKTCHCIFIEDGAERFLIEKVWIVDSDDDGIHIEGTTITVGDIRYCKILNADGEGIFSDMDADNYVYYLTIEKCVITYAGLNGILLNDLFFGILEGNKVFDSANDGICIQYSERCVINGNISHHNLGGQGLHLIDVDVSVISNNVLSENSISGLRLHATATENLVIGNFCYLNDLYGIFIDTSTVNNVVGNYLHDNENNGIYSYRGVSNNIASNFCYTNGGWGIRLHSCDFCTVSGNYTNNNTLGSINIADALSDQNTVSFNTVEEGAPVNTGTNTRSYGNYDPSANAFVGNVGAAPW